MTAENEKWDVMVSYNWKTGEKCADDLYKALTENGYKVWIDKKNMNGDLESQMAKGVANSDIILLLISEEYEKSFHCEGEYTHARTCRKKIIPIQVENYLPPPSSKLAFIISGKMYYQLFEKKEENMKKILKEIDSYFMKRCPIKVEKDKTSDNGKMLQVPVAEAEDFAHIDNPNCFVKEWNESFQQIIVVVKNVCWLHFIKRIPFSSKGRYRVRLHMYLGADADWPQTSENHRTYVRMKKVDGVIKTVLVEEIMPSNIWHTVIQSDFDNSRLSHSTIVADTLHAGWYFLELESFSVENDSELEFEFCDIENQNWKTNIKFNSIELINEQTVKGEIENSFVSGYSSNCVVS